jgi:hypothetical protein
LWSFSLEGEPVAFSCALKAVELTLFPLGTPIITFKLDWVSSNSEKITLSQIRTQLFVAKFRREVPNVHSGWTFPAVFNRIQTAALSGPDGFDDHLECIGDKLAASIFDNQPISLGAVAEWLCRADPYDGQAEFSPRTSGKHAFHHTIVTLDRELSSDGLQETLFHLRRAYGQKNRPPPPPVLNQLRWDKFLSLRANRHVGLAREGSICISWLQGETGARFELENWPEKWQGIYFYLCLHVHGERAVLEEISHMTATEADELGLGVPGDIPQIQFTRMRLRRLAGVMMRYTLSMSSDDCGGLSEYSEFFTSLRECFGIPQTRAEIDDELSHVMSLVESSYIEERRKADVENKRKARQLQNERKKLQKMKDAEQRRLDITVSVLGSLTLPLLLAAGVWGMNNHDLPQVPFWYVVGGALMVSFVMCTVLVFVLVRRRRQLRQVSKRFREKWAEYMPVEPETQGPSEATLAPLAASRWRLPFISRTNVTAAG